MQVTVTAEDDKNDSKYMVYPNSKNMIGQELSTFLERHLLVYTKWDEDQERELIDYVALTQRPDEYRNSNTISLSSNQSNVSKRDVVKARAGRFRPNNKDSLDFSHNYAQGS